MARINRVGLRDVDVFGFGFGPVIGAAGKSRVSFSYGLFFFRWKNSGPYAMFDETFPTILVNKNVGRVPRLFLEFWKLSRLVRNNEFAKMFFAVEKYFWPICINKFARFYATFLKINRF